MGRISKVFYTEVDPRACTVEKAGEYFFLQNMLGINPVFNEEYEKYETDQINLRNRIIGYAMETGELKSYPKMNTMIFNVSSIKNNPVICVEI